MPVAGSVHAVGRNHPWNRRALLTSPVHGPLAQLVAHLHDAQGVTGSSPVRPTDPSAQDFRTRDGPGRQRLSHRSLWERLPSPRFTTSARLCRQGVGTRRRPNSPVPFGLRQTAGGPGLRVVHEDVGHVVAVADDQVRGAGREGDVAAVGTDRRTCRPAVAMAVRAVDADPRRDPSRGFSVLRRHRPQRSGNGPDSNQHPAGIRGSCRHTPAKPRRKAEHRAPRPRHSRACDLGPI